MTSRLTAALVCLAAFPQTSCRDIEEVDTTTSTKPARPTVYTVNYPLYYIANRIGGDAIDVRFPAPADIDPAFWKPDAKTIAAYQKANLILLNGANYARWIAHATLPNSKLVNTSGSIEYITVSDGIVHSHGPGEHSHAGLAATTWIDPLIAIEQARSTMEALSKLVPSRAAAFQEQFDSLESELKQLDEEIQRIMEADAKQSLLASHPVYQYLSRRYGWNLQSVAWEPDSVPNQKAWQELERLNESHQAHWMIWEAQPLDEIEMRLNQQGIQSVTFKPCGNRPDDGDFMSVMRANVARLEQIFHDD